MSDERSAMSVAPSGVDAGATSAVAAATVHVADEAALRFIEDTALLCEQAGHPRMAGRMLAWLMICDPPHQTAGQIAAALSASKASVSTNIRVFVDFGVVEKFILPSGRLVHYRLRPAVWPQAIERSLPLLQAFLALAERGLKLVEGHPPECRARVREMRDFYEFYAQGVAELAERWRATERREGP